MILGLTGAIGCGKSTACAYFVQKKWRLFDADKSCHALYADPGSPLCREIRKEWGSGCFNADGSVDRKALAERLFAANEEMAKLTAMLYPALFGKMEEEIARARQEHANLLCEVPLLFECGTEKYFDKTAVVWCSREVRHDRLCRFRGFTPEEIAGREARQWPAEKKLEAADVAFINNGGAEFLYRQIDDFIKEFQI
ncbi:MAG: dephospho-CoA kinase [Lentisphaeria bacterium]|nr:dephospho-CoA kinase [Lentisphaeria bacterium]